ncbi:MAG: glycoside hydrolase family 13 protein [Leptolyngbyaceae bacterium]|nr:glycoside hydrolase family 13 protein [Leptolyngbyaceae bacterium]
MSIHTPDWVKHAVFYQIFPDRFARTAQRPKSSAMSVPVEDWKTPPTPFGYKGGDLWGIIEHLDYIQALGITAIYLNPIFQSACNHRYHTHDYYTVDPLLGGNQAFHDLLTAAHDRGLKVVLDGVFNHASRGFFFFNDILENGANSPWVDWFLIEGWPLSAYDGDKPANYVCWADNRALPKINHHNPQAREYIMQVAEHWIRLGVDGWRLDVANEIQVDGFWQEFRDRIKAINPEAYIVAEIWEDARPWLDGTQFDGVTNYLFTEPVLAFAVGDRIQKEYVERPNYTPYPPLNAQGYALRIEQLLQMYDWNIQLTQLNLLDSHDTPRIFTVAGGEQDREDAVEMAVTRIHLAVLLLMTFPGAPCVYYGDEIGLKGGGEDPSYRYPFPAESDWNQDMLKGYKELIHLRHTHPALRTGDYKTVWTEGHLYGFSRQLPSQTLLVMVNAGPTEAKGSLFLSTTHPQIKYGSGQCERVEDQLNVRVPAYSGLVIEL